MWGGGSPRGPENLHKRVFCFITLPANFLYFARVICVALGGCGSGDGGRWTDWGSVNGKSESKRVSEG